MLFRSVTFLKGVVLGTALAQLAVLGLYGYYSYSISILLIYASLLGALMVVALARGRPPRLLILAPQGTYAASSTDTAGVKKYPP